MSELEPSEAGVEDAGVEAGAGCVVGVEVGAGSSSFAAGVLPEDKDGTEEGDP